MTAKPAHPMAMLLVLCGALGGCAAVPQCPQTALSLDELRSRHNANAAQVQQLWARARISVTVADDKGWTFTWGSTSPSSTPNGLLLLKKGGEHDFVLIGREVAGVEVFRLGSSTTDGLYYMWYQFGDRRGGVFGRQDLAGAPGTRALAIDPHQVLSVLNVLEWPVPAARQNASPYASLGGRAVTLTLEQSRAPGCFAKPDPCAYVLTHLAAQPISSNAIVASQTRLTWSDSQPPQPFRVDFFTPDGRRTMTASVGAFKPVAGTDSAVMPTDIVFEDVPWPGRPSRLRKMHIVLDEVTAEPKGNPRAAATIRDKLPIPWQDMVNLDEPSPEGAQ
jgi:hypothetical protein